MNIDKLEQPCNANERYLYAVCTRLEALIHIASSLVEYIASKENVATTSNEIVEEVPVVKAKSKKTNK